MQFAAEPTSAAAPRTVLQAASARQVPIRAAVINLVFMSTLHCVAETTAVQLLLFSTDSKMNGDVLAA